MKNALRISNKKEKDGKTISSLSLLGQGRIYMSKEVEQNYTYSNESFSGCDMVATVLMPTKDNKREAYILGELQTISYSIHMDRRPVRSIGNINAIDYVMGQRTIAGSLVFAVFNKHFANKIMQSVIDENKPGCAFLVDELPPFDIVISFANEYGIRSKMVIYGVRLVNEGQVMSINDIYTENTYQFVATDLEYMTGENGYTSGSDNGSGMYKIIETVDEEYHGQYTFNYKTSLNNVSEELLDVELLYKVRSIAKKSKLGIVDLWCSPAKRTGKITIKSSKKKVVIDVEKSINGNNRVTVQLAADEYEAYWKEGKEKSNTVNFRVFEEVIADEDTTPAPLIEYVRDTSVKVYSNVKTHTKVVCEDEDGNQYSVKLSARKATINNLESDTSYLIFTCNDEYKTESDKVIVKTLPFGHDLYQDFIKYLMYNKKSLDNQDNERYVEVVYKAKEISMSGKRYETITDTFIEANKYYNEELCNLKQANFPDAFSYEEAINRLETLIAIASEIISISTKIVNDSIYGYNYDTLVVEPPKLEHESGCTSIFLLDSGIDSMEFYRQFTKTTQFAKLIASHNFESSGTGYKCRFEGRPDTNHYTYAINKYGFRSPRVDFYVNDNESKAKALDRKKNDEKTIQSKLIYENNYIGGKLDDDLSDDERFRVLTESAKSSDVKLFVPPTIIEVTDKSIKLLVKNSTVLKTINAVIAISPIENALINHTRYKSDIDECISFTTYDHGLRPGQVYCIWIEDSDGVQISDSITVKTTDNESADTSREYESAKYFINKLVSGLRQTIANDKNDSTVLSNILYRYENDDEITKTTVLDCVLEDILESRSKLDNLYEILYSFYKFYFNNVYTINPEFFQENLVLIDENIIIPEDCIAEIIKISSDGIRENNIWVKKGDSICLYDENTFYTIVSFISDDISKRSGFVISNGYSLTSKTNKLTIKVGK